MPTPNSELSPALLKYNSNLSPALQEYCRQRTEAAYQRHRYFRESCDRAAKMYPLPRINNDSDPVCGVPNDRMGTDGDKNSGQ